MVTVGRGLFALLCFLVMGSVPGEAVARAAVPLVEHEGVAAIAGNGQPATVDQIRNAFIAGGARRNWIFTVEAPDKLIGRLSVRSHQVAVDIPLSPGKFSVLYRDSVNLKFGTEAGSKMIHPQYNNWVNNLLGDVRAELVRQ